MKIKDLLFKLMNASQHPPSEGKPSENLSCLECNLYRLQFIHHSDGIIIFNRDGKVIESNEKISALFGYSLDELKKDFFGFVDERYLKTDLRNFKKALKGKEVQYVSVRIKKDGTPSHVHVHFTPFIVNGTVQGVIGCFKDYNELMMLQDQLNRAQRYASAGSWIYDPAEDLFHWTDEIYSIYGIKNRQSFVPTIGKILYLIHPQDRDKYKKTVSHAIENGTGYELEFRILKRGGELRNCREKAEVMLDNKGKVVRMNGVIQDITEKIEMQRKILEQEQLLGTIAQSIDVGIWSFDLSQDKLLFCSETIRKIYGVSDGNDMKAIHFSQKSVHPEDRNIIEDIQRQISSGKETRYVYRIVQPSGAVKWIEEYLIPTLDEKGEVIRMDGFVTDITEKKVFEEQLEITANQDGLTGLANRMKFEKELNQALEKAKQNHSTLSLFLIDIDRFINLNNVFGHGIGNDLLIEAARRLSVCSGTGSFLARLGGDQFGLFIENIKGMDESLAVAHKMLREFEYPFYMDGYELYLTVSVGLTYAPFDGEDVYSLLRNAEIALNEAKKSGGNDYYIYTPAMNIEAFKKYSLEKDLGQAIKNNELYLEYQPKVDSTTGKIVGAEALLRWKHPEWGMISPDEFIPFAENNRYSLTIGDWVLKQVCRQMRTWRNKGLDLVPLSINISYHALLKKDFVKNVVSTVKEYEIPPDCIEFEINEYTLIHDEGAGRSAIAKLQALGFRFALDNFGTGQSSLSYLSELEMDILKIDRSFMEKIGENMRYERIISNVITLAHELDMQIVAEGVETQQQLDFLRSRNCCLIQGYFYSAPLSSESFGRLLEHPYFTNRMHDDIKPLTHCEQSQPYQIVFHESVIGKMTITKIKDREVNIGYTEIIIQSIDHCGMTFVSDINLPLQEDILLKFIIPLRNYTFVIAGGITQKKEGRNSYEYGVKFSLTDDKQQDLSSKLPQVKEENRRPIGIEKRMEV